MHHILPPICLLLALALLVAGFSVWAVEAPEPNVALHQATAAGDDRTRDALEDDLQRRRRQRTVMLALLFGGSVVMTAVAFASMKPRR